MTPQQITGYNALQETITRGRDIGAALTEFATSPELFSGGVSCLLACFNSLQAAGLVPRVPYNPQIDDFLQSGGASKAATLTLYCNGDDPRLGPAVSALGWVVTTHRALISFPTAQAAPAPAPAAPIDVRVVGMPTRITETGVTHDAEGNITSATQTERDEVQEGAP